MDHVILYLYLYTLGRRRTKVRGRRIPIRTPGKDPNIVITCLA